MKTPQNKARDGQISGRAFIPDARLAFAAALLLPLGACESGSSETGPGGVSEGEARALDEAAEMLDSRQLPEDAIPPAQAPAGEGPAEPSEPAEVTGDNAEQSAE